MNAIATVRSCGREGPVIVFVHGVGSTAAIWDYQLREFGDAYRCFALELRGNGVQRPDACVQSVTREGFVEDVLSVVQAVGAARFHFVGCSLGGVVGFELCKRVLRMLASITFVGSYAAYPDAQSYVEKIVAAVREAGTMERFAVARAEKLAMPPGKRTQETIEQMACKSPELYIASTYATWTADYRDLLPRIELPTLVICGENDTIAPPALSREIARGIPAAQLEIIPGAGHVANADAPGRFNAILREFLLRM